MQKSGDPKISRRDLLIVAGASLAATAVSKPGSARPQLAQEGREAPRPLSPSRRRLTSRLPGNQTLQEKRVKAVIVCSRGSMSRK